MRLVSFNINGIRARFHQLDAIIDQLAPDIIGLQEIKVADEDFPHEQLQHLGMHIHNFGQKGHYGVALLSRDPPASMQYGFPWDSDSVQRRFICGEFPLADGRKIKVINGYFPQGESREHPVKFPGKQRFYQDLMRYLDETASPGEPLVVMGDLNISPTDLDIGIGEENRKRWLRTGKCSFLPEEREWLQRLIDWGLTDSFRSLYPHEDNRFSWFDYRSRGFDDDPKRGLRIDHIWITDTLREQLSDSGIDYGIRSMEKPSDHAPIWADLSIA